MRSAEGAGPSRHPARTFTALLIVGAVSVIAMLGSGPATAGTRSAFCGPHRTPQSFGGRPVPGFAARLVAAPGSVRAGGFSTFRLVNEGSDELAEVTELVQRRAGSSWIRMPEPSPTFGAIAFVAPRSVSGCSGPSTGKQWRAGRYRYLLEVEAIARSDRRAPIEKHWLQATFTLRRGSA
jgi:hypothetical protein